VYMITKDTLLREPVVRKISIFVDTVEISTLFLAAIITLALFIILGISAAMDPVAQLFASMREPG